MTVSMNGIRKGLARAYMKTLNAYKEIIEDRDPSEFQELEDGLTDLRQMLTGLFCSYDPDDELFTDMSDDLEKLPWPDPFDEGDDE